MQDENQLFSFFIYSYCFKSIFIHYQKDGCVKRDVIKETDVHSFTQKLRLWVGVSSRK